MTDSFWGQLHAIDASAIGKVVTIHLNRPKVVNAINSTMETEIYRVLKACDEDERVKCVIIAAKGHSFSAGHDIRQVAEEAITGADPATIDGKNWYRTGELLPPWWFRKALVIAVKGFIGPHANALLLAADAVIAAENSIFSWEETRVGIGAPYGAYALMPFHFPIRVLKHLWMPGGWMDADTARRLFYVNRVVPVGEEERVATEFAELFANMDLNNLMANKKGIHKLYEAAGLLSMVGVGREPHIQEGSAGEALHEHFKLIYEKGVGAAARTRDQGFNRDLAKI